MPTDMSQASNATNSADKGNIKPFLTALIICTAAIVLLAAIVPMR